MQQHYHKPLYHLGYLRVFKGDFGCPSLNVVSLQAMALVKFANVNIKITYGSVPQWTAIPQFENLIGLCYSGEELITAIQLMIYLNESVAHDFSSRGSDVIMSSSTLTTLEKAIDIIFWCNARNYNKITKPYYCRQIPFPFSYFYLKKEHKQHVFQILPEELQEYVANALMKADRSLRVLSDTLANSVFLTGDQPSALDAFVYGLLAPLYYAPLENCGLRKKLMSYENLVRYITDITRCYFPEVTRQEENGWSWWSIAAFLAFGTVTWMAYKRGYHRSLF